MNEWKGEDNGDEGENGLHSVPVGPRDSRRRGSKRMLRSERWWSIKFAACLRRSRPDGTTGMMGSRCGFGRWSWGNAEEESRWRMRLGERAREEKGCVLERKREEERKKEKEREREREREREMKERKRKGS